METQAFSRDWCYKRYSETLFSYLAGSNYLRLRERRYDLHVWNSSGLIGSVVFFPPETRKSAGQVPMLELFRFTFIVSANLFDGDLPCLQATLRWCAYMRASSLNSSNLHGYSMHMSLAWRAAQNFVEPMLLHLTCKYAWCVCIYIFWNNLVYAHCACDWIARLLGLLPGFVMPYARIFKCAGRRFASIFQWACAPDKFLCDFDCLPYRMLAFRSVISWPSH